MNRRQSKQRPEGRGQKARVLLLLAGSMLVLAGCASTEPENYSSRPWDSPKSWETGLPSALTEGR